MNKRIVVVILGILLFLRVGGIEGIKPYIKNIFPPVDGSKIQIEDGFAKFLAEFTEPNLALKREAQQIYDTLFAYGDSEVCLDVGLFFSEFADIIKRDKEHLLNNSQDFVDFNCVALDLAFADKKIPGIGALLGEFFLGTVSLEPNAALKKSAIVDRLNCVAWCSLQAMQDIKEIEK